jgi:hypothetical protein
VKKVRLVVCPDCTATGFMGGTSCGIYCTCPMGTARELFDIEIRAIGSESWEEYSARFLAWMPLPEPPGGEV